MRFTYKYLSAIENAQQIKLDSFVHYNARRTVSKTDVVSCVRLPAGQNPICLQASSSKGIKTQDLVLKCVMSQVYVSCSKASPDH